MHSKQLFATAVMAAALVGCGPAMIRPGGGEEGVVAGGFGCNFKACVPVVVPPKLVEAGGLKRLALVSANAGAKPGSDAVVTRLEADLSKVRVNDAPYYTLLAPTDRNRQASFEISSALSVAPVARVSEERSKCNDKKCKSSSTYNVSCQVRTGTAAATVRIKKPDGTLIATRQESGTGSSKSCQGEDGPLGTEADVLSSAVQDLVGKIHDTLAVRSHMVALRSKDDSSAIADAGRKKRFEEALTFFKSGRLDRACPVFEELAEIERRSSALFYNFGFCVQAQGDWQRANNLYRQADGLTTAPDAEIAAAITETRLSASTGSKLK